MLKINYSMDLQKDFTSEIIELRADNEGEVIAVLLSSKFNVGKRKSVLYIHGYVDYFFHPHLCEEFHKNEFDFYALDLRKYGRSLLPHQTPNYCENIEEYYEELDLAIDLISKQSASVYLLGHSTGGLLTASYMNNGTLKDKISGLILNSPFLDMTHPSFQTKLAYKASKVITLFKPNAKIEGVLSPIYAKSVHKDFYGEWDFNLDWKPISGFSTYLKWYRAIVNAQNALRKSNIQVPVLLLHSNESFEPKSYTEKVKQADTVLNVNDMIRIGPSLGNSVTLIGIKGGMHDLFLSAIEVRKTVFRELFVWIDIINK